MGETYRRVGESDHVNQKCTIQELVGITLVCPSMEDETGFGLDGFSKDISTVFISNAPLLARICNLLK